jgi:2-polyprenyl-3-methyl-5-hydroxy-6-metoxy-1,4-benzoquinol methylase
MSPEPSLPLAVRIARRVPFVPPTVRFVRRSYRSYKDWRVAHERSAKNITRKNTVHAYNRVYGSDSLLAEYLAPARLEFYDEVAERCASLTPQRVIDVGCGTGHLLRSLVGRMPAEPQVVVGVDRSRVAVRRAREVVPKGTFVVADLYRLPLDAERFDLVLCTEVLEHVRKPALAVEVLCRLCARGGRVAITVPDGAQDSWEGHVNFWNEGEFRAFLAPYALVGIDRIEGGQTFLAWLAPGEQ